MYTVCFMENLKCYRTSNIENIQFYWNVYSSDAFITDSFKGSGILKKWRWWTMQWQTTFTRKNSKVGEYVHPGEPVKMTHSCLRNYTYIWRNFLSKAFIS